MAAPFESAVEDRFGGVTVKVSATEANRGPAAFAEQLGGWLDQWADAGKRGIWLDVPLAASAVLGAAVELGFGFHHAGADGAVLTLWLPEDELDGLPAYPHIGHGVGGIVLSPAGEVLGIQEKVGVRQPPAQPHLEVPAALPATRCERGCCNRVTPAGGAWWAGDGGPEGLLEGASHFWHCILTCCRGQQTHEGRVGGAGSLRRVPGSIF